MFLLGLCWVTLNINLDYFHVGDHLKLNFKAKRRDMLIVVGWAVLIASITLQGLYERLNLTIWDMGLLFAVSVIAGMVLVDAGVIILGYIASLTISMVIMFICLILPAALGKLVHVLLGDLLYQEAIILIFRSMIPIPVVLCIMGGLVGGIMGESLKLR